MSISALIFPYRGDKDFSHKYEDFTQGIHFIDTGTYVENEEAYIEFMLDENEKSKFEEESEIVAIRLGTPIRIKHNIE